MESIKFNSSSWNPLPKKKFNGYKKHYDFSWILENVMGWNDEIKKEISVDLIERATPIGILYYNNTYLGEPIEDVNEFFKQRREYIEYIVKRIKGC